MDDHNPPTSSDPFNDKPLFADDDELMQLISSVFPQEQDVSAVLENNPNISNDQTLTNNNTSLFQPLSSQLKNNNVVEFNSAPAPSNKGKKNTKAMETERKRRHEMASLYQQLRSLVPTTASPTARVKRLSISDLLQETTNHINNMQMGIKRLGNKRDELLRRMTPSAGSSSSNINDYNSNLQRNNDDNVTVKASKEGLIEVIFSTSALYTDDVQNNQSLRLSKVLRLLSNEGLNVMNCASSRMDCKLDHIIQAQVDHGRRIDLYQLQQILTNGLRAMNYA